MAKKYQVGDVHAPVEDLEVPFGLKLLVFFMFIMLIGIFAAIFSAPAVSRFLFG